MDTNDSLAVTKNSRMVPEKRKSIRKIVKEKIPILIFIEDASVASKNAIDGVVTDINQSGMCVFLQRSLLGDTKVTIEFQGKVSGKLKGTVVWCRKVPVSGRIIKKAPVQWRLGIELSLESEDDKQFFEKILVS